MTWIIVYYDNTFKKFGNIEYFNVSKSEAIEKFTKETPKEFALINIIQL